MSGKASLDLIDLWIKHNDLSDKMTGWGRDKLITSIALRSYGLTLFCVGFTLFFGAVIVPDKGVLFITVVLISGFFLVCGLLLSPGFGNCGDQLIKDLKMLSEQISACGTKSLAEVKESAGKRLEAIAADIVAKQRFAGERMGCGDFDTCARYLSLAKETRDQEFKPTHALFCQFGLVEKEWDIYFDDDDAGTIIETPKPAA